MAEVVLFLLLAEAVNLVCIFVHGLRLKFIMLPRRIPIHHCTKASYLFFGASAILPARLGDLVRPLYLKRHCQISFAESGGVLVALQVAELIVISLIVLLLLSEYLPISHLLDSYLIMNANTVMVLVFLTLLIAVCILFLRKLEPAKNFVKNMLQSAGQSLQPKQLTLTILVTIFTWSFSLMIIALVLSAFSISYDFFAVLLIFTGMLVGGLLPILPGALGTFEGGVVLGLTYLQVDLADSFLIALTLRFIIYSPPLVYSLFVTGSNLSSLYTEGRNQ